MIKGEIWLIKLDPTIGAEISKTRPVIIVNDDDVGKLPLSVVVPITDWKNHYAKIEWMTKLKPDQKNGLSKLSAADAFQVRSVSHQRFVRKMGKLPDNLMNEIIEAIAVVLGIKY